MVSDVMNIDPNKLDVPRLADVDAQINFHLKALEKLGAIRKVSRAVETLRQSLAPQPHQQQCDHALVE